MMSFCFLLFKNTLTMKQLLKSLSLGFIAVTVAFTASSLKADAQRSDHKDLTVAYTYQQKFRLNERWGMFTPGYVRVGIGACFTKEKLKPYIGATVKKIRFYFPEEKNDEALFMVYNSYEIPEEYPFPAYKERQRLMIKAGWNEITLQDPIKIDGKRIIFPAVINISDPASRWVGTQDLDVPRDEMAAFIYDEGGPGRKSTWSKGGSSYFGKLNPFPIQLILDAPKDMKNVDENKVAILGVKVNGYYPNSNKSIPATIEISNIGSNDISKLDLSYTYNGTDAHKETLNVNLPFTGAERRKSIKLNLQMPNLGRSGIHFNINSANDVSSNLNAKTSTSNRRVHVYDPGNVYPRTLFVERTATTDNGYSPVFADTLASVLKPLTDQGLAIIMEHHFSSGKEDPYALPDGQDDIFSSYGLKGQPYMFFAMNREPMYSYSEVGNMETILGFPLHMYDGEPTQFRDYLKKVLFDEYEKIPGLAEVKMHPINIEAGKVQTLVFGKLSNSVSKNRKRVILMIEEDGLPSAGQASFGDGEYKHNNVVMLYVTKPGGEEVKVEGNEFVYTSPKIDYVPKGENARMIAILMDESAPGIVNQYVLNAASCDITSALTSVDKVDGSSKVEAYVNNGSIVFNDPDIKSIEVFDMTGAQISNEHLPAGYYFVKGISSDCSVIVIRKIEVL